MSAEKIDPSEPLPNPRHERFAQALAGGKDASAAFVDAGYKPSRSNASRLSTNENVQARVRHLQAKAAAAVTKKVSVDRQWVLDQLIVNAVKARKKGDFAPSNRALELLGKEIAGMFVDHRRVSLELDEELQAFMVALRDKLDPAAYDVVLREAAAARQAAIDKHKTGLLS